MSSHSDDVAIPAPTHTHEHEEHHPHLAHQFDDMTQQTDSYSVGMWIFLVTEVMFFGGLFTAYIVYRNAYTAEFTAAHHQLDWKLGGLNTFILLTSSLTMALAVRSSMLNRWRAQMGFLIATWFGALGFMVIKYFEYSSKIEHHLVPGPGFAMDGIPNRGAELFFSLYFAMTGLHGFHVLMGMIVIGILIVRTYINRKRYMDYMPIEMTGLYWHFVDLVWIFLYPMLYLVGQINLGGALMSHQLEPQKPRLYAHVDPIRDYIVVWIVLMVLLVVTVLAAIPDLGGLAVPVAMGIALVKSALVIMIFMGMRHSTKLMQVWAWIAMIFLFTMFFLFLGDYFANSVSSKGEPKRLEGPQGWEPSDSSSRQH